MSLNKDNSHSWIRNSHVLNKLVTNLNNKDQDDNEQETSEMQFEDYTLRLNASDFASRSKAKANSQRRESASSSTITIPIGERTWTDSEPQKYSLSDYPVSKKLINLLRHGSLPREDDGAIEFLENKRLSSGSFCVFSTLVWWTVEEQHGKRRRKQEKISVLYWSIRSNSVLPSSPRSFETQSYWSFITGQCRDSGRFLQVHLSRWMCDQFTFHHQFRIDTRRTKFEQKTDSILSACGWFEKGTQRSWYSRPESTASCTVPA